MREIRFIKTNPTQNMTLLIETATPREECFAIAKNLIAYENVYAEQAGFIEAPVNPKAVGALYMMAGEFCGNATLSLGAWLLWQKGLGVGETEEMLLEVSGAKDLIPCTMTRRADDFFGRVEMPLAERLEMREFVLDGERYPLPVVVFEGITHVIVNRNIWQDNPKEKALRAVEVWGDSLPEAFGILLWDAECRFMEPLVCVKGASLVWERGCGSGTCAIGIYESMKKQESLSMEILQPGGTMEVKLDYTDKQIAKIEITGAVKIVATGTAFV